MRSNVCGLTIGLVGACLLLSSLTLVVRAEGGPSGTVSAAFTLGIPEGDFKDQLEKTGLGIALEGGVRLGPLPILLGPRFSYLSYGSDTRHEPFSQTIPDVTVEVETSYNLIQFHGLARFQPIDEGLFQPYLDGLIGLNYLYTETSVRDEDDSEDSEIASSKNFEDTVFSYGGGGGIQIAVHRSVDDDGDVVEVLIDLNARYISGGKARYLKEGAITIEEMTVIYDVSESRTDLVTAQIGIGIRF